MEYDKEEALHRARMTVELNNLTSHTNDLIADLVVCDNSTEAVEIKQEITQCEATANHLRDQFWDAFPNALVTKSSPWNY